MAKAVRAVMMVLASCSLLLSTPITGPGARAFSLGAVGPLFPFNDGDGGSSSAQQDPPVRCEEHTLALMCDTCPQHLPVCSLDLAGCSWDCLPRSAARDSSIFHGPSSLVDAAAP